MFWEDDSENNDGLLFTNFLISNFLSEHTHVRDDDTLSCIDLINRLFLLKLGSFIH